MPENPRRLGVVLYPDFELLDVFGPLEMFGNVGPELQIETLARDPGPVRSAQGPQVLADRGLVESAPHELLLVPGGVGTLPLLEDAALLEWLRKRSELAEITMSVCSGSAILARAGLLDGFRATSNKQFFSLARRQSDAVEWVEAARWVDAGRFVTSSGVSAGTDMALAVIERLYGTETATRIAELTEYERHEDPDRDPFVRFLG